MASVTSYLNTKGQKILDCEKFQVDHKEKETPGESCTTMKTRRSESKVTFMGLGTRLLDNNRTDRAGKDMEEIETILGDKELASETYFWGHLTGLLIILRREL